MALDIGSQLASEVSTWRLGKAFILGGYAFRMVCGLLGWATGLLSGLEPPLWAEVFGHFVTSQVK